jgi:hypothetical protein
MRYQKYIWYKLTVAGTVLEFNQIPILIVSQKATRTKIQGKNKHYIRVLEE